MVFSSTVFLFLFLPLTLLGYYLIKDKFKNAWLLLVSIIFFSWSQPQYLWIIILNIIINYIGAYLISYSKKNTNRQIFLISTVFLNLLILYYFKYFDFTIKAINQLFNLHFALRNIILPIGISFFTFQGLSYTVDVYRKKVSVQKIFLKLLYILFYFLN